MDDIQEQRSVSEQKDVCVDSQRNKSIRNQHAQYYLKKKKEKKRWSRTSIRKLVVFSINLTTEG